LEIKEKVRPQNVLLVVDAMIGQDAVKTAGGFNERLDLTGVILTKLDGDARGGAALSIKEITGKPIKFLGEGEGLDKLTEFRPEGLASRILGAFVAEFDAPREDGWVAERGGATVGSIFLMKSDDPRIAKLRLLYVEPSARGAGVGRKLVDTCVARARELDYRQLTLWTNDILVAARRIYQAAGFRLVSEAPHHSFGHDLVGQTWTLDLG